jgi:hypothetical protein
VGSSAVELQAEARRLLVAFALTSTKRACSLVDVVARNRPDSAAPDGERAHPAEAWAVELERLVGAGAPVRAAELERFVGRLRAELDRVRRRPLAEVHVEAETLEDLAELIIDRGADINPKTVAISLRCTPTMVRRARLAAGRDPERGRLVEVNGNGAGLGLELVGAGLSTRAASALSGVARSTLHDQARRVR